MQWAKVADGIFPPLGVADGVQCNLGVDGGAGQNLDGAHGGPLEKSWPSSSDGKNLLASSMNTVQLRTRQYEVRSDVWKRNKA